MSQGQSPGRGRTSPVPGTVPGTRAVPDGSADGGGAQSGVAAARAERMERLGLGAAFQAVGDVLGERRAVLEAVPRAAAEQPPRRELGMAVEDEVRVRRQVVLA